MKNFMENRITIPSCVNQSMRNTHPEEELKTGFVGQYLFSGGSNYNDFYWDY